MADRSIYDNQDPGAGVVRAVLVAVKRAGLEALAVGRSPLSDDVLLRVEKEMSVMFGGAPSYVAQDLPIRTRMLLVRQDIAAGLPPREIARRHDMSVRTVQRYMARDKS